MPSKEQASRNHRSLSRHQASRPEVQRDVAQEQPLVWANVAQKASETPRLLTSSDVLQLQRALGNRAVRRLLNPAAQPSPIQKQENDTGLPDSLKDGIENLSGLAMDDVRVHYNSDKPVELQALAFTRGTEIHVGPGHERHLPHEAWHLAQQMQGRVQPTEQTDGGIPVNDDAGLEHEADVMGGRAAAGGVQPPDQKARPGPVTPVVQRISKLYAGKEEIKNSGEGAKAFAALNSLTKNFAGEVWFNSVDEMVRWIRSGGTLEGIGVWDGRWMNLSGKTPIVFGEEHNEIRTEFIDALHITHYIVEGAAERSLTGVSDADIPAASQATAHHKKYTGQDQGKALENYWARSAQGMARFWIKFENELKAIDPQEPSLTQIERLGELEELIRTVKGIRADSRDKAGKEKEINDQITNAQFYLNAAEEVGLPEVLAHMKKDYRAFRAGLPGVLGKVNARGNGLHYLYVCFSEFRKSIEQIGYLNFAANATEEDLSADEATKNSKDPFEVWGGRRELFMLKNLTEALTKTPKPLIITMGAAHARHQQDRLESLLGQHGGMLVIGRITDLADVGAVKLHQVSEDISEELAMMYGWSEGYRKEYAESDEAREKAKIRVGNTKIPVPSYIS